MKEFLNNFLLFFQFFTRVPINKNLQCGMDNFRKGSIFFPVIGLFIGMLQWLVYYLSSKVFPGNITAALVLMVPIIVTGGLHVDGLGDTIDGFFSFKGDKNKILEIMKDSRVGTFACIAIVIDILLRFTVISTAIQKDLPLILIVAPIIARFTVVFIAFIGKSAKEKSSGNIFIGNIDIIRMIMVSIIAFVFCFPFIGIKYTVILMVLGLLVSTLFNLLCIRKIGGHTGDTLGANYELLDVIIMLLFIALNV